MKEINKLSPFELGMAIHIGNKVLKEVGEPAPLIGKYLQAYNKFNELFIEEDIKYLKENNSLEYVDELETEKLHIECFCRWLQEEYKELS
jgi:hypothetical protein